MSTFRIRLQNERINRFDPHPWVVASAKLTQQKLLTLVPVKKIFLLSLIAFATAAAPSLSAAETEKDSQNDPVLRRYLEKNPAADADGDGVLTWWEREQHVTSDALEEFPPGTRHMHVNIPMRDGFELAAEVFLPPEELAAPYPVVLCRAGYGRWKGAGYGKRHVGDGMAYVTMDVRKFGEGAPSSFPDPESSRVQIEDTWDSCEWLVAQSWCNGRIGTTGASGNGFASSMGYWALHPAHVICGAGLTAGNLKYYWAYQNGVAHMYGWMKHNGLQRESLRPTLFVEDYDYRAWLGFIAEKGTQAENWYTNDTGWYDPLLQGVLDDFTALQNSGKAHVKIAPRGHGGVSGFGEDRFRWPEHREPAERLPTPSFTEVLKGEADQPGQSVIEYFLMGDVRNPQAPGNQWVYATKWPPDATPTPMYLRESGQLRNTPPKSAGRATYTYDPLDPAPHFGGHYSWRGDLTGPHDQRPLRERSDVLYFETAPLEAPVNVTGRLKGKLFISSTAPDTMFIVKLVDIYPDGYEAILREGAAMARYADGFENPVPLEKGRVIELEIDLWSTANVFDTGHRIAVIVTSSAAAKESRQHPFEIHPNTWEPVPDSEFASRAVVAENTVHFSPEYPSSLVLPIIADPE